MAAKIYVSVKCDVKDVFDTALKPVLLKAMGETIADAINNKSGGKLTTKDVTTIEQDNSVLRAGNRIAAFPANFDNTTAARLYNPVVYLHPREITAS